MDKQQWIADKIKKLVAEGKPQAQAVAEAESMWEADHKKDMESADSGMGAAKLWQDEVHYVPLSSETGAACANCRWFMLDDGVPLCHLVASYPLDILPTGYCDRHEAIPMPVLTSKRSDSGGDRRR